MFTNTPPNGAFRGFGAPQTEFAVEVHLERIAEALGMDSVTLREINALVPGDTTATGQLMREDCSARLVLDEAVRRTDFRARRESYRGTDRAVGLSLFYHARKRGRLRPERVRSRISRLAADRDRTGGRTTFTAPIRRPERRCGDAHPTQHLSRRRHRAFARVRPRRLVSISVEELNVMLADRAAELLRACCGASRWVTAMVSRRPFFSRDAVLRAADDEWSSLDERDWLEAFSHHPRIGEATAAAGGSATART